MFFSDTHDRIYFRGCRLAPEAESLASSMSSRRVSGLTATSWWKRRQLLFLSTRSFIMINLPLLTWFSTARILAVTTAGGLFIPCNGSIEHGIGASHTALNRDGVSGTVHLARTAFHARDGIDQRGSLVTWCEHGVGADCSAHPAIDALFRVVLQCV